MKAQITRPWDAVPPGEVYGRRYQPGDIVEGELAALAIEVKAGEPAEAGQQSPAEAKADPAPQPRPVRAKVNAGVEGYAAGALVEGDVARELVAAGKAKLIKDRGGAPETK